MRSESWTMTYGADCSTSSASEEKSSDCGPAGDREVRARPDSSLAEAQPRSGSRRERGVVRHRPAVQPEIERGPRHGDQPLVVELELRADERDLEESRVARVADDRVGQPVRHGIHRSGDRHAARLQPPSPFVLNRRLHAGLDDDDGCDARLKPARSGSCVGHSALASLSYSTRSIA
jgi:hypothetical protein